MWINYHLSLCGILLCFADGWARANNRQRRYLLFTKATQWGVFATVSIPLHPETTTSVAWFYEANYYNVDNSTYLQPLLGDIPWGRNRYKRSDDETNNNSFITRTQLYNFIEVMLDRNGYPGRPCLLLSICEAATSGLTKNGVLGDLLHLILTPSASLEEVDLPDSFYEAEYRGLEEDCGKYSRRCPISPLDYVTVQVENI